MDRSHGGGRPNRILSTAALFRRQEQAWRLPQPCCIDRSNAVLSTRAVVEAAPTGKPRFDSSPVMHYNGNAMTR